MEQNEMEQNEIGKYGIEYNGKKLIIWHNYFGVGLSFTRGEPLQRYLIELVIKDWSILQTPELLNEISDELIKYAEKRYPMEFQPINTNKTYDGQNNSNSEQ